MPSTSHWSRIVPLAAVLLCLAGNAGAESGDYTDAAFAALLAMPGVQPREGGWIIPEQEEPAPENEKALIAQLLHLKKSGANINAMRHRGTLLAHAIRAGKDRTAIWLLRNGSDPKRVLLFRQETAYDLARQFKRVTVVKVLEDQYGFKPPESSAPGAVVPKAPVPAASEAKQSREQRAIPLLVRLLGPTLVPSEAGQREWREFAAALSREEYVALFKDGKYLEELVRLVLFYEGGLEDALSRLPLDLVRRKAQLIADLLAEWSYVTYYSNPKISYTAASLSWPALWSRIDQPLRYEKRADLAGRIPPTLWPGLFASGYSRHDAEVTGCLLSAVDLEVFKVLWPDFLRFFTDAREEAPALVLRQYRVVREHALCHYGSSKADTVAKLAFLREQGVTTPVAGLRDSVLNEADDPSLAAMAAKFSPRTQGAPRLVQAPLTCVLALNDVWLDALVKVSEIGWGIPAEYVQAIDVPGQDECGLIISGDRYHERSEAGDDFFYGPMREGSTRCGDAPDDREIWVEEAGRIRRIELDADMRGTGTTLRTVLDVKTGKRYVLNEGKRGALCSLSWGLPDAYEWPTIPTSSALLPSRDGALIDRLLSEQCEESSEPEYLKCRGLDLFVETADGADADGVDIIAVLRKGGALPIKRLADQLGTGRREAYGVAIATRDRVQIRRLLAAGISPGWTASEIRALGTANLPLDEKRRRIALLFASSDQLSGALNEDRYDLPKSLLSWLPAEDWKPVLRVIGRNPDLWHDAAGRLRDLAEQANRPTLACDIDRTQGFLCGGGIQLD